MKQTQSSEVDFTSDSTYQMEIIKEKRVSPRWLPHGNNFKLKQRTFFSKA